MLLFGVLGIVVYAGKVPQRVRQMTSQLGDKWNNLNPQMKAKALAVIAALDAQGIKVGIPSTGGWRSQDDQANIDPANTNVVDPLDSYHVWGLAVDFVPLNAAGAFDWSGSKTDPQWQAIGAAIKAQGLTWGGDFHSLTDLPHGELHLDTLADLKANYDDPLAYIQDQLSGAQTA